MEHSIIRICNYVLFAFLIALVSCGYVDNDGIKFQKKLVGNLSLVQINGDHMINLVLNQTAEISFVVVSNCKRVFSDYDRNKFYVESVLNDYNSNFYLIEVLDSNSVTPVSAYKQTKLESDTFISLTRTLSIVLETSK